MTTNTQGITQAVGGYQDIIRMWEGQQRKLEEFPELWAANKEWPAKGGLVVCNDIKETIKVLRTPATTLGINYRLFVRVDLEHGMKVVNVSALTAIPGDSTIAQMIKATCKEGRVRRFIVVEPGPKVTLYRNQKRGQSLDDVLWAAMVKVNISHQEYTTGSVVRISGNLVWDGDEETSTVNYFLRNTCSFRGNIALDLSRVEKMDSAGLGGVIGTFTSVINRGDRFVLLSPPDRFRAQLKVTKLDTILRIFDDETLAVQSFETVFE